MFKYNITLKEITLTYELDETDSTNIIKINFKIDDLIDDKFILNIAYID